MMNPSPAQNNNDNNTGNIEDITYRKKTIQSFIKIFVDKFGSNSKSVINTDQLNSDNKSNPYRAEINIIQKLNSEGVVWGIGASILSFAVLRKGPKVIRNYILRKSQKSIQVPPPSASSFYHQQPLEVITTKPPPEFKQSGGKIWNTLWFAFDLFLSVWAGTMFSFVMTDKKRSLERVSEIPLVEGRSMLSEELCSDFILEYQKHPNQLWNYSKRNKDENDSDLWLFYIQNFVKNCKRRQAYEHSLKEESGYDLAATSLSKSKFVSLPAPGVPRDYHIEEDDNSYDFDISSADIDNSLNDFQVDEMTTDLGENTDSTMTTTTWSNDERKN